MEFLCKIWRETNRLGNCDPYNQYLITTCDVLLPLSVFRDKFLKKFPTSEAAIQKGVHMTIRASMKVK